MAEPFLGEIRIVGFTFAPRGWATCSGQLLPINQNTALFSLLGTTYGGNGQTTFGLPDLRGRTLVGMGQGPGLSNYYIGQASGTENVTLTTQQIAAHVHNMMGSSDAQTVGGVAGSSLGSAGRGAGTNIYAPNATSQVPMGSNTSAAGGNQAHSNMQP